MTRKKGAPAHAMGRPTAEAQIKKPNGGQTSKGEASVRPKKELRRRPHEFIEQRTPHWSRMHEQGAPVALRKKLFELSELVDHCSGPFGDRAGPDA